MFNFKEQILNFYLLHLCPALPPQWGLKAASIVFLLSILSSQQSCEAD